MVIYQRDGLVLLKHAIHADATHLVSTGRQLLDRDVVDDLPMAIMECVSLPVIREAWRKAQSVHFQFQAQQQKRTVSCQRAASQRAVSDFQDYKIGDQGSVLEA